ncbi:hypothetical protein Sjap_014253 [Stephania japonica]|uniref:RNase H type-1 domain-containing protein n=1 Tax=Stephania japonica TaxID=461633 RepID=A0AAP0J213_9MAGN
MYLWVIWRCKNNLLWINNGALLHVVVRQSMEWLVAWTEAKRNSRTGTPQETVGGCDEQWSPLELPTDWFKCNTDAALFDEEGKVGLSGVVRNDMGLLIYGHTRTFTSRCTHTDAEADAMTIKEALSWVDRLGLTQVIF